MQNVYINKKPVQLLQSQLIGVGGEAEVYDIGLGNAFKLFKNAQHPDFKGNALAQRAAKTKLIEHQTKLRNFPDDLPERVIVPSMIGTNKSGRKVLGYGMPLITNSDVLMRYTDKRFRTSINQADMISILLDLHATVTGLHNKQVIIGDFNDLNVMVQKTKAYLIDADSMQFGNYLSKLFTDRFVDPLLCDQQASNLSLIKPHNEMSDWYAFTIMVMQSLLFVGPYGGVYRPKDKTKRVKHHVRPLKRITLFDREVKYPKPALPLNILPDDLLELFHRMFIKDIRGIFPNHLLESLRFTTCTECKKEHAKAVCPYCTKAHHSTVVELMTIRGSVTARKIFYTPGTIVDAVVLDKKMSWLYHDQGAFRREDRSSILKGALDQNMRVKIQNKKTLFGKNGKLFRLQERGSTEQFCTELFRKRTLFDTNGKTLFWIKNGQLFRETLYGSEAIGNVLSNQTLFWTGDTFGLGFYRAGGLTVGFVFDSNHSGINDSIEMPQIKGNLLDARCTFSQNYAWLFITTKDGQEIKNTCLVFDQYGVLHAKHVTTAGDDSWLSNIHGSSAAGKALFVPTDDGIVRVELSGRALVQTRSFPDTEPFVSQSCKLFLGRQGLFVVNRHDIIHLTIK